MPGRAFTIGSTHELDAFAGLLERHGVTALADVRRHPGSRRHPQFASLTLAASLPARGILYAHLPRRPGRRLSEHALPDFAVVEGGRIAYRRPSSGSAIRAPEAPRRLAAAGERSANRSG